MCRRAEYFYPRPPRGGRPFTPDRLDDCQTFLSTSSARRTTFSCSMAVISPRDFYPRPPRGGRQRNNYDNSSDFNFYPRPPRGGRQFNAVDAGEMVIFLSTSSARRTTEIRRIVCYMAVFLSTSSARRTTIIPLDHVKSNRNFYPRPPRGGRPDQVSGAAGNGHISIHVLREEDD